MHIVYCVNSTKNERPVKSLRPIIINKINTLAHYILYQCMHKSLQPIIISSTLTIHVCTVAL